MPTANGCPTEPPPFDGRPYIADTSAWARSAHPRISREWERALSAGQIYSTPAVAFEVLQTAQNGREFDLLTEELEALREISLSRSILAAGRSTLRRMAHHSAGLHRIPMTDLLVAVAAENYGIGVLHYDGHFDRLASFLHFESRWIIDRQPG